MPYTTLLRVDNTPAEDGAYDIGAILVPDEMETDELEAKIADLHAEWKEENPIPDADSDFVVWLEEHGHFESAEQPHVILLT